MREAGVPLSTADGKSIHYQFLVGLDQHQNGTRQQPLVPIGNRQQFGAKFRGRSDETLQHVRRQLCTNMDFVGDRRGYRGKMEPFGLQPVLEPVHSHAYFRVGELRVVKPIGRTGRTVVGRRTLLRVDRLRGEPDNEKADQGLESATRRIPFRLSVGLFVAECDNRVQAGRLHSRPKSEEESDAYRNADAEGRRPERNRRRQIGEGQTRDPGYPKPRSIPKRPPEKVSTMASVRN